LRVRGGGMKLKIDKREANGITILSCQGRIMFGEDSSGLRDAVRQSLSGSRNVVVNLSQVTYIDSGALGMLVGLSAASKSEGAHIKLAAPSQRLRDVLHTTKLLSVFEVYDTEEEALASAGGATA
jgi:anti-sigma B factor antagonist